MALDDDETDPQGTRIATIDDLSKLADLAESDPLDAFRALLVRVIAMQEGHLFAIARCDVIADECRSWITRLKQERDGSG